MIPYPSKPINTYRAGSFGTTWRFPIPAGVPLSVVLSSDYPLWVHNRKAFSTYDLCEFIAEDGTFDVMVRITFISEATGLFRFRTLVEWSQSNVEPISKEGPSKFKAAWVVGKRTFCVQEVVTGKYVSEGFPNKEEAEAEAVRLDTERKAA